MKNWEEDDDEQYCAATEDLADAQSVCDQLDIWLHTVNFSGEYWDHVFEYFLAEYRTGRTPNPDIMCNKEIKFKAFLDHALSLGANHIATGHYARIDKHEGNFRLLTGVDRNKDQSYFLYTLGQRQLQHALFPLGDMHKTEVRKIATEANFINHRKKDSTGICFIGERKFSEFLNRFIPAQPGKIITPEGDIIGKHNGLMFFTLGQRQGLGIGGVKNAAESPWFVVDKDLEKNHLIVAQGHNHPRLLHSRLSASQLHWVSGQAPNFPLHCEARIRYRQNAQTCTLTWKAVDGLEIEFEQPQRAITPGQSVVIYQQDDCLGGGIIDRFSD
jgi:tRNA-specific 2-thiouridylase